MSTKLFYILKGNNGATYICNAKNWKSSSQSLKFYRARSLKASILKQGLHCYLFLKGILYKAKLKRAFEINQYLQKISTINTTFNIDKNCSVLISPTNDKVIVHHHNEYFQKFAFGKSYQNVKKEATIYALLTNNKKHFQTSSYYDVEDKQDELISFKLSNTHISTITAAQTEGNLVPALLEFFKATNQSKVSIKQYVGSLQSELQQLQNVQTEPQEQVLETININYGELVFPLGLVHRDFKPWNMVNYSKPLIFDFEEALTDGPPLEDLLNYYMDPVIRYNTKEAVVNKVLNDTYVIKYKAYLKGLNIEIEFKVFLHFYLIERLLFWHSAKDMELSNKYLILSTYFIEKRWH